MTGSEKKSREYSPPSLPIPDALTPPNGVRRSRRFQQFTQTMPVSRRGDTRCALDRSRVHTVDASPYALSLASARASSSVSNGARWQTGPKISSFTVRAVSGSPVRTVGSTWKPPSRTSPNSGTPPPATTVAPSSRASR